MKFLTMARTLSRYWRMANDPRTPKIVKFLIYGGLVYTLSPIDILPDWMPLLGLMDDAAVLPSLIALAMLLIPKEVKQEHDARKERDIVTKKVEGQLQARRAEIEHEVKVENKPYAG